MGAVTEGVGSPFSPPQLWSENWFVLGSSMDPARGPGAWSPAVSMSFPGWHSAPGSALLGVGGLWVGGMECGSVHSSLGTTTDMWTVSECVQ